MRRSSLACSQFKPPRSINISIPSDATGPKDDEDAKGTEELQNCERIKRIRMSTCLLPEACSSLLDADNDKDITESIMADESEGFTKIASESTTLRPLEQSHDTASTSGSTHSTGTATPVRSNESQNARSPPTPWFLIPAKIGSKREGWVTPTLSDSHKSSHSGTPTTPKVNAKTIEELMAEKAQLEAEIIVLEAEENKAEDLDDYMELLHKYNNAKDIAQCLMGELALRSGITVRQVAENIGAPIESE